MGKEKYKDMSHIAVLLNHSKFFSDSRRKIILQYIVLCVMIFFIIVSLIIMISWEQQESSMSIAKFLVILLCCTLVCSSIPIVLLILIIKNEKIRNQVNLWLEDAVQVEAIAKRIDTKYWIGLPLIKLQVEFNLYGIHYIRTTESELRGKLDLGRPLGYFAHLTKYADRKINILYSPKYDQVMILKD